MMSFFPLSVWGTIDFYFDPLCLWFGVPYENRSSVLLSTSFKARMFNATKTKSRMSHRFNPFVLVFFFFLFNVYLLFADRKLKERVDKSIATEAFVLQKLLLTVSTVILRSRQKIFSSWLLTHLTGGVDLYFVLVFRTRLCRKVPKTVWHKLMKAKE